ncbi:tRNA pseudouridine(38-40) synthase TruA [Natronospora cellulosivora (SeqCode)]
MQNIKITLEYDGSKYSGWQIQKNTSMTIQEKVEIALKKVNKKDLKLMGASRTDAGVHALGQVANCLFDVAIPPERVPVALNRYLPADIICKKAEKVSIDFHARYDSKGKKYLYRIYNNRIPSVFIRNYAYHYIHELDISLMQKASKAFLGEHDFSSFQSAGCAAKNPVKTIETFDIYTKGKEFFFEIKGSGFLYNMIRIMVGTLIEVSEGKIKLEDMGKIIEGKDRNLAGFTAPAKGLTLLEVYY